MPAGMDGLLLPTQHPRGALSPAGWVPHKLLIPRGDATALLPFLRPKQF